MIPLGSRQEVLFVAERTGVSGRGWIVRFKVTTLSQPEAFVNV